MTSLMIFCIRLYQLTLRLLWAPSCRFIPSCSEYAVDAFRLYGFWMGFSLVMRRLSRCHPWGERATEWGRRWGDDPVAPSPRV